MALSVTVFTVTRRLQDGFPGSNLGNGVGAVMSEAVERFDREKRLRDKREHQQAKNQSDQSKYMLGHACLSCHNTK